MKKKLAFILAFAIAVTFTLSGCGGNKEDAGPTPLQAYYEAIDTAYSLDIIEALTTFGTNPDLGFRVSGSTAELAAADYLYGQMEEIGLQNVVKDPITVDTWEFKKAELAYQDTDGAEKTMILAAFATQYVAEDEELSLVFAGRGTEADFAEVDVNGKLVLLDIDQDADWWVNWPAYQAKLKGAKAVLVANVGGYDQYSDETLGVQDICGPADAPAFSITVKDSEILKELIDDTDSKSIDVKFTADSQIVKDGTAYTVIGEIPGATDEVIYMIGHYDGYFHSFEDNASGIGAIFGIAKALVDSGYEPQKTIRFIAHPSEEWGLSDSRYDWATGAYETIQKHPEWIENAFALINVDGGVTSNIADGILVRSSWALSTFAMEVGIEVEGSPFENFDVSCPPTSWTEDFAYAQMGIPVLCSGYSGDDQSFEEVYHSNMDTKEYYYDAEAFSFSHKLYGTYLIKLDQLLIKPLDYSAYFKGLSETIDLDVSDQAEDFSASVDNAMDMAQALNLKMEDTDWTAEDARAFNKELGALYKYGQDHLVSLDWWESVIFAHERYQGNVLTLQAAIDALEDGDVDTALDEYLYAVDMNWVAYAFDRGVYDYFVNQVLGKDARNAWGTGYLKENADLFDVIKSLQGKAAMTDGRDYTSEIRKLKTELTNQQNLLDKTIVQMTDAVDQMTATMEALAE